MKTWVDAGTHTAIGLCECGYRVGPVADRETARRHLAIHEANAHSSDRLARVAHWKARHAGNS